MIGNDENTLVLSENSQRNVTSSLITIWSERYKIRIDKHQDGKAELQLLILNDMHTLV